MEAVRNSIASGTGNDNPRSGKRSGAEYRSWVMMKQRCQNPNSTGYDRYGGRGIKVCDRWQSFDLFAADMGPRPAGMSLDRINNEGNYEPDNCRWATKKQQQNNCRPRSKPINRPKRVIRPGVILGRPKAEVTMELRLPVRFSADEITQIRKNAYQQGCSTTTWVRKRLGLAGTGYGE